MAVDIEAFDGLVRTLKVPEEPLRFGGLDGCTIIKTPYITVERRTASVFGAVYFYNIPQLNLHSDRFEQPTSNRLALLHKFICSLSGNEVEDDTSTILETDMSPLFWDSDWKRKSLYGDTHGQVYNQSIYPATLEAVLASQDTINVDNNTQFVDLFGGDGEFIHLLCDQLVSRYGNNYTFHIIDSSGPSLDKAKKLLGNKGIVIIHDPYYLEPDKPVFPDLIKPPRFITAIGGLYAGVISRKEALGIADRVYQEMEDGGIFFVTGFSSCLLNREDFLRIGFRVLQMTKPENVVYFNPPHQLYVLQKPSNIDNRP